MGIWSLNITTSHQPLNILEERTWQQVIVSCAPGHHFKFLGTSCFGCWTLGCGYSVFSGANSTYDFYKIKGIKTLDWTIPSNFSNVFNLYKKKLDRLDPSMPFNKRYVCMTIMHVFWSLIAGAKCKTVVSKIYQLLFLYFPLSPVLNFFSASQIDLG
jgi:hypothetical protein